MRICEVPTHCGRLSDQAFLIAGGSAAGSEQRREVVSTALFTESDEAAVLHLFGTRADCRRRGHGSQLLQLLERHVHPKPVFVEAVPRAGNRAPEFWERRKHGELITVGPGGPSGRWYPGSGIYGRVGSNFPSVAGQKLHCPEKCGATVAERKRSEAIAAEKPRSDYHGVSWDKRASKWRVRITVVGSHQHVGQFDDEEDAARAYDVAARASGRLDRLSLLNFPTALVKQNSRYVGVSQRDSGQWMASIHQVTGCHRLGYFDDEEEAAKAYDAAARAQRGEQAHGGGQGLRNRLNFPTAEEEAGLVRLAVVDVMERLLVGVGAPARPVVRHLGCAEQEFERGEVVRAVDRGTCYAAKVTKVKHLHAGTDREHWKYFCHYDGWNVRHDKWLLGAQVQKAPVPHGKQKRRTASAPSWEGGNKKESTANGGRRGSGSGHSLTEKKRSEATGPEKKRSDYRGVSWDKQSGKWRVQITVDGIRQHVGNFDDEEDAARAFDVAARASGRADRLSLLNFPTAAEQTEHTESDDEEGELEVEKVTAMRVEKGRDNDGHGKDAEDGEVAEAAARGPERLHTSVFASESVERLMRYRTWQTDETDEPLLDECIFRPPLYIKASTVANCKSLVSNEKEVSRLIVEGQFWTLSLL